MFNKGIALPLFVVGLLAVTGCNKEKWDKTTSVGIAMAVSNTEVGQDGDAGYLKLNGGHVKIASVAVSGVRLQGDDAYGSYNSAIDVEINEGTTTITSMHLEQGTYSSMDVNVATEDANNAILLNGHYTRQNLSSVPVQLKIHTSHVINMRALENDGTHEVVLIEGKPRAMMIELNLTDWFADITSTMWENADQQGGNGQIKISATENIVLYNTVINRLQQGFEVKFQ